MSEEKEESEEKKILDDDDDHPLFAFLRIRVDPPVLDGIPVPETTTLLPIPAQPILLLCVSCQTNQVQTVNFPCMHACFCIECAKPSLHFSQTCPVCRCAYQHISMLYPSYVQAKKTDFIEERTDFIVERNEPELKKQKLN